MNRRYFSPCFNIDSAIPQKAISLLQNFLHALMTPEYLESLRQPFDKESQAEINLRQVELIESWKRDKYSQGYMHRIEDPIPDGYQLD